MAQNESSHSESKPVEKKHYLRSNEEDCLNFLKEKLEGIQVSEIPEYESIVLEIYK